MNPKISIIDRATTHYDETLSETFKKYNGAYVLIPPGLTRFIQPLDVSINGPLKKKFHHWYLDYIIEHKKSLHVKILLMLLICYGMMKQL